MIDSTATDPSTRPLEVVDEPTFNRWVEAFRGPLVGFAASRVPDWGAASEVAQDTFAEAWLGRDRFRGDPADLDAAGAWLRGIAVRLAAARARGDGGPGLAGLQPMGPRLTGAQPEAPLEALPSPVQELDPRMEAMASAFVELSDEHREVLRMHYLERTRSKEVAALLGITAKALERRLYRARADLRERTLRALKSAEGGVDHE